MLKRFVLLLALAAALVACSPAGTGTSPAAETLAPVDTSAPTETEMASESPSPS